jgi:hypothetical protein
VTLEQILILAAVFVLVPLLNALVRALRRRLVGPTPRESGSRAPETSAPVRMPSLPLDSPRRAAGGAPPPLTDVLQSRRRPKVRIASAQEARRGILLMTVLGPCRGLEP